MKTPLDNPAKPPKNIRHWVVACGAYAAMVGVSVAAAATLVSETMPLVGVGF